MRKRGVWITALLLLLTLLWMAFIFSRSLQPADLSSEESDLVLQFCRTLHLRFSMRFVRKCAHYTEYLVLGVLLYSDTARLYRKKLWIPCGIGLAAAAVDELLQRSTPGRSGQLTDVLLDFSGVLSGCLLCLAALWLYRHRRRKRKS